MEASWDARSLASARPPADAKEVGGTCVSHRVLLVEDDPLDARQLDMALGRAPQADRFELTVAPCLSHALSALENERFALIALDLSLPDAQGSETFERVRTAAAGIPIVILTGREDDDLAVQLIHDGAQDYLLKSAVAPKDIARCFLYAIHRGEAEQVTAEARLAEKRANDARATFLARMSHEIRTPLNAVLGMAELLRGSALGPEQREHLGILGRAGRGLKHLLDNVLEMAKLDAGCVDLDEHPLRLQDLVAETVEIFGFEAHRKGVAIVADVAPDIPCLSGDAVRLRQVLVNLIGNAIKFTTHGSVDVEATWDPATSETCIVVRDSGPGIPEDRLEAIFEPFEQAGTSVYAEHGGTGLGLAISRLLVDRMGGSLAAYSPPEGGALFRATLPMLAEGSPSDEALDLDGMQILLVVGGAAEQRRYARWLSDAGGRIRTASCTSEASAVLADESFDAVVLETRLPETGGLNWLREVGEAAPPIRIALLMTNHRTSDHDVCAQLGARAMLKPLRREALIASLAEPASGATSAAEALQTDELDLQRVRVLLAEDGLDNQAVVRGFLKGTGADLTIVEDGAAAVEAALREDFDVVLMDVSMPIMNGFEATREIRLGEAEAQREPVPIIALTAHSTKEASTAARACGCDDFVTKPFDRADLCESIAAFAGPLPEDGPDDGLDEFLDEYWEHREEDLVTLRDALEERDFPTVQRLGHQMRGSGGCYGLPEVTEVGAELEEAGSKEDSDRVRSGIHVLAGLVADRNGAAVQASPTRSL